MAIYGKPPLTYVQNNFVPQSFLCAPFICLCTLFISLSALFIWLWALFIWLCALFIPLCALSIIHSFCAPFLCALFLCSFHSIMWLIVINEIFQISRKKLDFVKLRKLQEAIWPTVIEKIFKFRPHFETFGYVNYLDELFLGYPNYPTQK